MKKLALALFPLVIALNISCGENPAGIQNVFTKTFLNNSEKMFFSHINDFQVIDEKYLLTLSVSKESQNSEEVCVVEKMAVQPAGKSKMELVNSDRDGVWPIAISNVLNQRVAIASLRDKAQTTSTVDFSIYDVVSGYKVFQAGLESLVDVGAQAEVFNFPFIVFPIKLKIDAHGDVRVLVRTADFKIQVLHLTPDLRRKSSFPILNFCRLPKLCVCEPMSFELTSRGDSLVGMTLNEAERQAIEATFHVPMGSEMADSIMVINDRGEMLNRVDLPRNVSLQSLQIHGERLGLAGTEHRGEARNFGVAYLALYDVLPDRLNLKWDDRLPVEGDLSSMGLSALPLLSGGLIFGGKTGFEKVSTGSTVRPGNAFLIEYDPEGRKKIQESFRMGRDNAISQLRMNNAGGVYAAGHFNAPITHDEDRARFSRALLMSLEF